VVQEERLGKRASPRVGAADARQGSENLVEQRRAASCQNGVEGRQDAVLVDIYFVRIGSARQFGGLAPDISDIEYQIRCERASNREVVVLRVRRSKIRI